MGEEQAFFYNLPKSTVRCWSLLIAPAHHTSPLCTTGVPGPSLLDEAENLEFAVIKETQPELGFAVKLKPNKSFGLPLITFS